jgi:hypothetical protein
MAVLLMNSVRALLPVPGRLPLQTPSAELLLMGLLSWSASFTAVLCATFRTHLSWRLHFCALVRVCGQLSISYDHLWPCRYIATRHAGVISKRCAMHQYTRGLGLQCMLRPRSNLFINFVRACRHKHTSASLCPCKCRATG